MAQTPHSPISQEEEDKIKRAFQNKGKKRSAELKNQQQKQRATYEHSQSTQ